MSIVGAQKFENFTVGFAHTFFFWCAHNLTVGILNLAPTARPQYFFLRAPFFSPLFSCGRFQKKRITQIFEGKFGWVLGSSFAVACGLWDLSYVVALTSIVYPDFRNEFS